MTFQLPPAEKYWVTDHGVKLRKPTQAVPYYRIEYRVGGRRVSHMFGKDLEAAWAEAVRYDRVLQVGSGRAHELPLSALAYAWMDRKKKVWSARYAADTRDLVDKVLLPEIGGIPIGDFVEADFIGFIADRGSLSAKRSAYACLSALLTWGKGHKWISGDVAELIPAKDDVLPVPAARVDGEAKVSEAEIPSTGLVMALFREMQAPREYASKHARKAFTPPPDRAYMVLLAGFCGLRQGEVFALRGKDLKGDELLVDEQVQMVRNQPTAGLLPKGHKIRRVIVPEDAAGVALLDWVTARAAEVGRDGLLFPNASGGVWRKQNYGRDVWRPARRAVWAEFPDWTFHSLRHHCATWLLNTGTPASVVSHQLGHASVKFTIDTYVGAMSSSYDEVRAAHKRAAGK